MANERLVTKGRMYRSEAVTQQARVAIGNAVAHAPELASAGWQTGNTEELESLLTQLLRAESDKTVARTDAMNLTLGETEAHQEVKATYRKVREALGIVLRDGAVEGLTLDHFTVGDKMRGTANTLLHLERVIPLVARLDAPLSRFFPAQKASELLDAARARLEKADSEQELARGALPTETVSVLELKGRILDLVEELNAIARIAFDGQAELRAKFNKDLLLRGRRRKSQPTPPTDPV